MPESEAVGKPTPDPVPGTPDVATKAIVRPVAPPAWRHPVWSWAFLWSVIACGLVFERQTGASWAGVLFLFACTVPGYVAHQRALNARCLAGGRDSAGRRFTLASSVITGMSRVATVVLLVSLAAVLVSAKFDPVSPDRTAAAIGRLEAEAASFRAEPQRSLPGRESRVQRTPDVLTVIGQDGSFAVFGDGIALVYLPEPTPSGFTYRCVGMPRQGLPKRCSGDFPSAGRGQAR